jgi:FkbM family methyltransferase
MTIVAGRHGVFETLPGDSVVADSLTWYGEWAENELGLLRRFIAPGDVVADIGSFIGTHAVAMARTVGPLGQVHAFEPRRDTYAVLTGNLERNQLTQVVAHNVGVSDRPSTMLLDTPDPSVRNLGSLALVDAGEGGYPVQIITLDSLELPRLALVKIDVEGMEAQVLAGGKQTLRRCRPVVFAECNTVSGAAQTLAVVQSMDYVAYGAVYPAFNPDNFNQNPDNFFGANAECALFLVPRECAGQPAVQDMRRIDTLEDVVALLLEKPQYLPEVLPDLPAVPAVARVAADPERNDRLRQARRLHVVAPFYRNAQLVAPFFEGLLATADELAEAGAQVWLFNDSPGHVELQAALAEAVATGIPGVGLHVLENEANLGFIGTCNRAFATAIEAGADVLLLNSDTQLIAGAIREMLSVAALDPMFGFVCPRSNNATLASLPHSAEGLELSPQQALQRYLPIARRLPRFTLVPTAIGFALWIRGTLLAEFGVFDTAYGKGYNEENDFIMRANRAGYRAVMANHAFVWHQGEQSFASTDVQRSERDAHNGAILRERYPEYEPLVRRYYQSPTYRAEALLETLAPADGKRIIAFDFSTFGPFHNGTFESGVKLVAAALVAWPDDIAIAVIIGSEAWHFHGLDRLPGLTRFAVEDRTARAAAVVRIGQPYQVGVLERLFTTAPVVGIFMLDTISSDCGYLSLEFNEANWRFVFENTTILFTNSAYTMARIRNRYAIGAEVMPVVSRHSLDLADYGQPDVASTPTATHILVIGNHYAHKFVGPTADALAAALPQTQIVAVGYKGDAPPAPNIVSCQAGHIDEATFRGFYQNAQVVVFPSHYEGFGFPMLHALAQRRPVFVRDTPLNRELAAGISASANIHFYLTTQGLVASLQTMPTWSEAWTEGEQDGWARSAREVHAALSLAIDRVRGEHVGKVLSRLDELQRADGTPVVSTTGRRIGLRLGRSLDRALDVPAVGAVARLLKKLLRPSAGRSS